MNDRRPRSPVTLLGAACTALLALALLTLPLALVQIPSVPQPAAPQPPATAPSLSTRSTSQAAAWAGEPGSRDGAAPFARGPTADRAVEPPLVERRWVQAGEAWPAGAALPPAPPSSSPALDRSRDARQRRAERFGGTRGTEDAVELGLAWLAGHQDRDGYWRRLAFAQRCPADDRCPGQAVARTGPSLDVGLTGLALLAFLGAGYTDAEGPYRAHVAAGIAALLRAQRDPGGFGADEAMAGYNDALATFALAEYYALRHDDGQDARTTRDDGQDARTTRVGPALERAVQRLVLSQQEQGGWDYVPRPDSGRNDTSVTAWAVQALQACAAAGVHVPRRTLIKAALHIARATESDGQVWYSDAGTGFRIDPTTLRPVYRYGPAVLAAGMTSELLLGWRGESRVVARQQARLLAEPPSVARFQGGDASELHSEYYWYYGTVAMFQLGGEVWERWNASLRDAVLPLQDRGQRHARGSWPPFGVNWGRWGRMGGRVYTTALCVLTLEIYYRHTPAYLEERTLLTAADWRAFLGEANERQKRLAAAVLPELRLEIGEPVLVELLRSGDRALAFAAALGLAALDSPVGRELLEQAAGAAGASAWERDQALQALRRVQAIEQLPAASGSLRYFDAERGLATLELARAYVGMNVLVSRDGREVARMRVIQRFTGRNVVVAELVGEPAAAPQPGDSAEGE